MNLYGPLVLERLLPRTRQRRLRQQSGHTSKRQWVLRWPTRSASSMVEALHQRIARSLYWVYPQAKSNKYIRYTYTHRDIWYWLTCWCNNRSKMASICQCLCYFVNWIHSSRKKNLPESIDWAAKKVFFANVNSQSSKNITMTRTEGAHCKAKHWWIFGGRCFFETFLHGNCHRGAVRTGDSWIPRFFRPWTDVNRSDKYENRWCLRLCSKIL